MKENIVVEGFNIERLLNTIQEMLDSGTISKDTIVTIDVLDGYRHGIEKIFVEDEGILTIGAKIHSEL